MADLFTIMQRRAGVHTAMMARRFARAVAAADEDRGFEDGLSGLDIEPGASRDYVRGWQTGRMAYTASELEF